MTSMKKIGSKWIGSVKRGFLDNKKEGKDGKEGKDNKAAVAEDPSVLLEEDNVLEETSEEVLNVDDQLSPVIIALREALKKVSGSTRQLVNVGKHLSTQISDSAIEKQLIAGYLYTLSSFLSFFYHHSFKMMTLHSFYLCDNTISLSRSSYMHFFLFFVFSLSLITLRSSFPLLHLTIL